MKFGKEFKSQMVPEWEEAYMNYDSLKSHIKEIHNFKLKIKSKTTKNTPKRTITMYRAFSGLNRRYSSNFRSLSRGGGGGGGHDIEDQVILVNAVDNHHDGFSDNHHQQHHHYETKFLMSSDEGGEYELLFFRRLDDEFNKVNDFYKDKVDEVLKEADLLNRQMDALIAFRIKVDNPDELMNNWPIEMTRLASGVTASAAAVSTSSPRAARTTTTTTSSVGGGKEAMVHMDAIEESYRGQSDDLSNDIVVEGVNNSTSGINSVLMKSKNITTPKKPASLDVLNHVTINNTLETPRSTIKGLLNVNKNKEFVFERKNLKKVEQQLQRAFVEFYQKLRLLKSYSFLNLLAFSKIMKKYDKIASRRASKSYLNMVDNSYLGSSDEVAKLMERVEATFIKHFTNANRSKGIKILRPQAKKERHRITFSLGFFSGCTLALILSLILLIHARNIIEKEGSTQYMENLFPLYSLFGFIVLHMFMYAVDIYAWRYYRVNYPFIFGFKQGTELGYREVFLLSSALATLALASVIGNLDMEMDVKTKNYQTLTELLPLMLVTLVIFITLCPFNIIYRSSRYFLLRCAFHCICAPFYKVLLPDFFLADQLTSQVQAIRSLEFYICYYGWGDFKLRKNSCNSSSVYNTFYFIIATIPYSFRLLQCLRRAFEEKDRMQGYNAFKYFSTIVAVMTRTAYSRQKTTPWWIVAWVSSAISAIISTYWDIVIDWGLLQRNSKNRWLRDKLLVSQKSVYFIAIVLNVLLRFAWLQTVLNFQVSFLHKEVLIAIVASLEIIRRGIWNFFRLENEHLNNVGKYRAFKSVPLPFNYDEDEDKDE